MIDHPLAVSGTVDNWMAVVGYFPVAKGGICREKPLSTPETLAKLPGEPAISRQGQGKETA